MSATKRGSNWSTAEDEALCAAWLNTSQDAAVGINQRAKTLYNRVFESFLEICTERQVLGHPELRAASGIKARWHQISKMVSKFAGCVAQITNRCQSGASPEDVIKQAIALFASTENTPFTLMHCYIILQSAPKWQQYHNVKIPANRKTTATESIDSARNEISVSEDAPSSSGRPIGQKASKARKLTMEYDTTHTAKEMAEAGKLLASTAKERLAFSKQKALALSRMANHSIMSMNLDGLNKTAKEYYLLEQKRILNETREFAKQELESTLPPSDQASDNPSDDDDWIDISQVSGTAEHVDDADIEYDPLGTEGM